MRDPDLEKALIDFIHDALATLGYPVSGLSPLETFVRVFRVTGLTKIENTLPMYLFAAGALATRLADIRESGKLTEKEQIKVNDLVLDAAKLLHKTNLLFLTGG